MYRDRIQLNSLLDKVVSAEEAASHIKNGMVVGMSGFTRAGEAKIIPLVLVERAKTEELKIALFTGASLGNDIDKKLTEAGAMARRSPFMADPTLRKAINNGEVMYTDTHLSETSEQLRNGNIHQIDVAVVEACAITKEGGIVPTTSVGNSAMYVQNASKVIVELNTSLSLDMVGMHDIYIPGKRGGRGPVPVMACDSRIGTPYIPCDPAKIVGIVISDKQDSYSTVVPADEETNMIAGHLIDYLKNEVKKGRLDNTLLPLQAGIGSIANAVLAGFIDSPFHDLVMYSEVLQDSTFELFDSGKMVFASGSSLTLSQPCGDKVFADIGKYKDRLVLRPQEISNLPEISRRLGVMGVNTALEFDIYGNVNSTHVGGTHMMNGIGGSGDFARNAHTSIFVTKSMAKGGKISSVVPMVPHVDHCEHDVDILVTEIGLADLRGLAPRERAPLIIENCMHPEYRDAMRDYYKDALKRGGHTPHVLEKAYSWAIAYNETGNMKDAFGK